MRDELTLDTVRNMAIAAGLTRLTDEHLEPLLRATKAAVARQAALPTGDLTPADEPAHIFRVDR